MEDTTSTEHRFIAILGDEDHGVEMDSNARSADRLDLLSPSINSPMGKRRELNIYFEDKDSVDRNKKTPSRRAKPPKREKMKYVLGIKDLNQEYISIKEQAMKQ